VLRYHICHKCVSPEVLCQCGMQSSRKCIWKVLVTFKCRFYVDKCKCLNLPIQLLCFQDICSQGCKKVTALNGDAIIQRDIRSNITVTGYRARYGRGGWWGVLIFVNVKMKEGYQLASYPLYVEVRYVSKWYLGVKT
jgi:hypothetical protein